MKSLSLLISLFVLSVVACGADNSTHYVIFLQNKILEDMPDSAFNQQYGSYEYDAIKAAFQDRGYVLYSEERPYGTDPDHYSWLVARQVDSLLKEGISPESISVVGTGKGALITMLTSAHIRNDQVRYVVLSGCNELVAHYFNIDLYGTVLSIREKTDYVWVSCDAIKDASKGVYRYEEVELNTGLQNGYLYKPMNEWLSLVYAWVEMYTSSLPLLYLLIFRNLQSLRQHSRKT